MFVEGDFFREQRRFTLRNLRDFGFGKTSSEQLIHEEIHDLITGIEKSAKSQAEGIVDFENLFNMSMINILWAMVGGERFNHHDIRLKQLLGIVELFFRSGNLVRSNIPVPGVILRTFPKLRELLGLRNDIFLPLQDFIRVRTFYYKNNLITSRILYYIVVIFRLALRNTKMSLQRKIREILLGVTLVRLKDNNK